MKRSRSALSGAEELGERGGVVGGELLEGAGGTAEQPGRSWYPSASPSAVRLNAWAFCCAIGSGTPAGLHVPVLLGCAPGGEGGRRLGALAGRSPSPTRRPALLAGGVGQWRPPWRGLRRLHRAGQLPDTTDPDALAVTLLATLQGGLLLARPSSTPACWKRRSTPPPARRRLGPPRSRPGRAAWRIGEPAEANRRSPWTARGRSRSWCGRWRRRSAPGRDGRGRPASPR